MAVKAATALSQPKQTVIVLDIEDWTQSPGEDFAAYCEYWKNAVNIGGYHPCLYANESTFTEMGSVKGKFNGFWLATGANVTSVPAGYSVVQGTNHLSVCGISPTDYDLMNVSAYSTDWTW